MPVAKGGVLSEECGSVKESRGAGTRSCASTRPARWQRGGQRNQRRKWATTCANFRMGGFWTTTPPCAHAGRAFDVSRWKGVGGKNRSWSEHLRERNYRTALGTFLKLEKERAVPLVDDVIDGAPGYASERLLRPGSSARPWFTASFRRDSSLAVIQAVLGPANFRASTDVWRQLTLARTRRDVYVSVHPHFAGNVHASVRASGIEKERSCRTACATSPMLVGRDRSFRNWSAYQDRNQRWVSLHESALASMGQQALARTQGRKNLECRLPCSNKHVQDCNRHFGTQRHDHVPDASQWSQHRSGARFQNSARSEVSGERSASVTRYDRSSRLAADSHSHAPAPTQAGNTRPTCRGIVDKADWKVNA